jgi:hypothetical protein
MDPVVWVKLAHYCKMTGDSRSAVYSRRQRGDWVDGIHCIVRGRHVWINLPEVQKWVELGRKKPLLR